MMRAIQTRTTPVEFVPEPHTDFIFQVDGTSWPLFVATIGAAALALAVVVRWRRRGRRDRS